MRKITRKEWIEALKSGEYEQAQKALHHNGGYCCLGVACHIAGFTDEELDAQYNVTDIVTQFDIDTLYVDLPVKFGSSVARQYDELASLNDRGKTFEQIADLLIFDTWARGLEQEQ